MLSKHPILAVLHLLDGRKETPQRGKRAKAAQGRKKSQNFANSGSD
jgi:hypothetical protein